MQPEALLSLVMISEDAIEGITVSGGEPLQQMSPLVNFLQLIRISTGLSTLVFSGYTYEEISVMPNSDKLLDCVDVLIAGRYDSSQRLAEGLRGSANQTFHFLTSRYRQDDVLSVPPAEVFIEPGGAILASGVDPVVLKGRT